MTMYQRARKLGALPGGPTDFHALADLQLEAYAVSINALSLVESKSAWFSLPASDVGEREVSACTSIRNALVTLNAWQRRKRQKISRFIPEEKYSDGNREIELVEMADIKHEYALLAAQVELTRVQPHASVVSGNAPSHTLFRANDLTMTFLRQRFCQSHRQLCSNWRSTTCSILPLQQGGRLASTCRMFSPTSPTNVCVLHRFPRMPCKLNTFYR